MEFAWGVLSIEQVMALSAFVTQYPNPNPIPSPNPNPNPNPNQVMELSAFVTQYRAFEFDMLAARPFGTALPAQP